MDGPFVRRVAVGRAGDAAVWTWLARCLPDAGGAVREFLAAVHRAACGADGAFGCDWRAGVARAAERRVLPDWPRDADRAFEQERDPDCRIRRTVARKGKVHSRCGDRGGADPAAANSDDIAGFYPWRFAAGAGAGCGPGEPAF